MGNATNKSLAPGKAETGHTSTTKWIRLLSMVASIAAHFLSICASERGAPESSKQRFPVQTPHIGQVTENICLRGTSLFLMVTECNYT
jgi:hypothetical protein